jgi:hypothetical protein
MGPVQQLKIQLLEHIQASDPEPEAFEAAVAEAVFAVSAGQGTGPAQAVASDLLMDWQLAAVSQGFDWLRQAGARQASPNG